MAEDILIRLLLSPLALLYGLGVSARNLFYRVGILKSVRFSLPVISVGNLSMGGAGKTPHIEYLVKWLDQYIDVAILSRGYGRKTVGYRTVSTIDTSLDVGDEPLQFKRKFPEVAVSVGESRALGVPELVKRNPQTHCVLLDDAFQHLAVSPGLNILLTEYNRPFTRDWLLPSGRLREWRASYQRADLIVVTKCPEGLTERQRHDLIEEINPFPRQKVFFSKYRYGRPYDMLRPDLGVEFDPEAEVLLISAIANTDYLLSWLSRQVKSVHTIEHQDHHFFDGADLFELKRRFEAIGGSKKMIVTTEKDATRLELHNDWLWQHQLPVYVLPVEVEFCNDDEADFQAAVQSFLLEFKS